MLEGSGRFPASSGRPTQAAAADAGHHRDLDLLAAASNPREVVEAFAGLPNVGRVLGRGRRSAPWLTRNVSGGPAGGCPEEFGSASSIHRVEAHNVKVRERAIRMGLSCRSTGCSGRGSASPGRRRRRSTGRSHADAARAHAGGRGEVELACGAQPPPRSCRWGSPGRPAEPLGLLRRPANHP